MGEMLEVPNLINYAMNSAEILTGHPKTTIPAREAVESEEDHPLMTVGGQNVANPIPSTEESDHSHVVIIKVLRSWRILHCTM